METDSAFQEPRLEASQGLVDEFGARHRLERIGLGHIGDPRVGEQIVDQTAEIVRFLYQQMWIRLVALRGNLRFTGERAGQRADVRERGFELVRHRRYESRTHVRELHAAEQPAVVDLGHQGRMRGEHGSHHRGPGDVGQ